ncbi:MAG TPA: DUF3604 domain-containing protein [Geminicoccaceae bacterium]|nr:DUF3604 domain-containing protein [Geminicoccaceae bacterium]
MPFSTYMQSEIGHAEIEPGHPLEAGSHVGLVITYTAGSFGIDDTGAIKISWRTASDSGKPQFSDPKAPNYTTASASNGATLELAYNRNNIRPWVNTLFIRVGRGFLRAGDRIVVRLGDRRQGSPGYRLQTAREKPFWFKVFVDAFATYDFVELPGSPTLELVPGPVVRWKAVLPTLGRAGAPFRLAVVGEDRWGNPSEKADATLRLGADRPVEGLPDTLEVRGGNGTAVVEGLRVHEPCDLRIDLRDASGARLARSNPLRLMAEPPFGHYWGDLHGQSGETVGTGSAAEYYRFARDKAFLDIIGHQGNDFQIDTAFWAEINRVAAELDEPGKFVALPGYEWSGNTGMGGDRNVFFLEQDRPIFRSSRVLLDEDQDALNDCHAVGELFRKLEGEDAVVIAHVGGRYADLRVGHDGRFERAVEIHSCWGTFEWLLHDAFDLGHRVGVVCHSDDHKGRPGAAWPGAGQFGAIGGLTCYLMQKLDRATLFRTLRRRHHYGTTGTRLYLDVRVRLPDGALLFEDDPALGDAAGAAASRAMMGDIVRAEGEVLLEVDAAGSAPLERIVVFNGKEAIATRRGYAERELGRRIRVLFEGAEYRGRGREVFWRGHASLVGNRFERAQAVNLFNADKPLRLAADGSRVDVDTVTTGNFSGFDQWLAEPRAGEIQIATDVVTTSIPIAEIGLEDLLVDAGGLGRRLRLFRLPDRNETWDMRFEHRVRLCPGDNPLYVRLTQEDGHQAWSSPVYVMAG